MKELIIKCPVCHNEKLYAYDPNRPKHVVKIVCDVCNVKFQKTIPGLNLSQRWIRSTYNTRCSCCGEDIHEGEAALWFIKEKRVECRDCGHDRERLNIQPK